MECPFFRERIKIMEKEGLNNLRSEIDKVNLEILNLLNKRAALVEKVTTIKNEQGIDFFDPVREIEMIEKLFKSNKGPLYNELIKEIYNVIFNTSLKFMGIVRDRKLLISSQNECDRFKIYELAKQNMDNPIMIAGPCAIEKLEYLEEVAKLLVSKKVKFLRGGAYKPRTSPYEFQGLGEDGLKMLKYIGNKYELKTISEVVDTRDVDMMADYVDIIQIGARNMHNFELLKEAGRTGKTILLKRGLSAKIQEFMYAAEYIAVQGNNKIILCERGIRTFENMTRNTLDISAIPILKKETNLPIIVDLSHSLGRKDIVNSIAKAVLAVGAEGIMVEVHPFPELALSDSMQQLNFKEFSELINYIGYNQTT